jgi:hypothetical protein
MSDSRGQRVVAASCKPLRGATSPPIRESGPPGSRENPARFRGERTGPVGVSQLRCTVGYSDMDSDNKEKENTFKLSFTFGLICVLHYTKCKIGIA